VSRADQGLLLPLRVSRETCDRLRTYEVLLRRWQSVKNLVSPSTLSDVWERHFRDSLQLLTVCPNARTWVDIGSGAGFPGMVIAIALADLPSASIRLIESDNRKCAFLREVARETQAAALVEHARAEDVLPTLSGVEVVTARAVAPLEKLVEMAAPLIMNGAVGLFPKGRDYRAELTRLGSASNFKVETAPSLTDDRAAVIIIRAPQSGSNAHLS
jgi:16S rRNA (guanine527-N7)-methyltransferase